VRVSVKRVGIAELAVRMSMLRLGDAVLVRQIGGGLRRVLTMSKRVAELGSQKCESEKQPENRGVQA
jgi:hypothetical protein